jgi:4-amino-4-deoxy-L-arabinose transferase-like glycosyltransferase
MINRTDISAYRRYVVIIITCFFAFFINGGTLHSDIMEYRNLVTAREIATEGHWLIPTMNGDLRLEKPPLPTWLAAAAWKAHPNSITVQRLMPAMAATMLIVFFLLFAERLTGSSTFSLIAALLLLTCYNIVQMGRLATWDIYCHSFMMGSIYFLYLGLTDDRHIWRNMIRAGFMAGLSFMSKGPVSFYSLLLPFLITILPSQPIKMHGRKWPLTLMIALCLIIGFWWYLYIIIVHPELAQHTLSKESSSWIAHNVRPWYYYWRFFTETGIWTVLMLSAMAFPYWRKHVAIPTVYKFSFFWMVLQLILLSLMPEKKIRYLLPMMIPCCLIMANIIVTWVEQYNDKTTRVLFYINAGSLALIVAAVGALATYLRTQSYISLPIFILTMVVVALLILMLLYASVYYRATLMVWVVTILFCFTELMLLPTLGCLFSNPRRHSIAAIQTDNQMQGLPLFYNAGEEMQIEVIYNSGKRILPIPMTSNEIKKHLPCAIVTERRASLELPINIYNYIDTVFIDRFDENNRWALQKHRGRNMVYYVTLLKAKNDKQNHVE